MRILCTLLKPSSGSVTWNRKDILAMDVSFVNENGETKKGFAAVRHLRDAQKEWAGMLDEEKLRQVIEENNRINATPEANSNNLTDSEIGTREIRSPWSVEFYGKSYSTVSLQWR